MRADRHLLINAVTSHVRTRIRVSGATMLKRTNLEVADIIDAFVEGTGENGIGMIFALSGLRTSNWMQFGSSASTCPSPTRLCRETDTATPTVFRCYAKSQKTSANRQNRLSTPGKRGYRRSWDQYPSC